MLIAAPIGVLVLYVAVAGLLVLFPANREPPREPAKVQAFIATNGVHAEFVFPARSPGMDWTQIFPLRDFPPGSREAEFIALGWGDREFYLNTPRWPDLTLRRALGALSGRNPSLVHATYVLSLDDYGERYRLPLTESQYTTLVEYVRRTLLLSEGSAIRIPGATYGYNDAFFEARGSYGPFTTCNTWVGGGLREAGVTVSRWTPFESNVYGHLARDPRN
ncbi:MAG: TIGR02117 family protein [Gammaproteobacteria bacterium]|nr:TIGR02117 family protein [Gammaproteobacteria bacterium]